MRITLAIKIPNASLIIFQHVWSEIFGCCLINLQRNLNLVQVWKGIDWRSRDNIRIAQKNRQKNTMLFCNELGVQKYFEHVYGVEKDISTNVRLQLWNIFQMKYGVQIQWYRFSVFSATLNENLNLLCKKFKLYKHDHRCLIFMYDEAQYHSSRVH